MKHSSGPILKKLRERAGLTQNQTAEALGYTSGQFISNIEAGKAYLPLSKVKAASVLYRTKPEVFTGVMVKEYKRKIQALLSGKSQR